MKRTFLIIIGLLIVLVGFSQPQEKPSKERIEAQRVAFITKALDLTPTEAQIFWPIYNDFEAEKKNLRKSKINIKKNPPQTEEEANRIIENHFAQQEKLLSIKRKYYQKFQSAIPPTKVVKLIRAERTFKKQLLKKLNRKKGKRQNDNKRH